MSRTSTKTKAEMKRLVSAAQKEAQVGSICALLEAVGPELTLGELIDLTDNPSVLLQIRCAFLSGAIAAKGTDEPLYTNGAKKKRPKRRTQRKVSPNNGEDTRQTALPGTEAAPGSQAPPRPEPVQKGDGSTDGKRDERVFKMIEEAGTDGIASDPILKKLGCTKAQLRYAIGRLRQAERIESRGEKRAQRHFVVTTPEPEQSQGD